jgi:hypothetical protein
LKLLISLLKKLLGCPLLTSSGAAAKLSIRPNTVVALREFPKPIPSSSPKVADYNNNHAYFDTLVFDAELGYAQV